MSRRQLRRFRTVERRFFKVYSAWQETHRMEFAVQWMTLVGELLRLNPSYSVHYPYQNAV